MAYFFDVYLSYLKSGQKKSQKPHLQGAKKESLPIFSPLGNGMKKIVLHMINIHTSTPAFQYGSHNSLLGHLKWINFRGD